MATFPSFKRNGSTLHVDIALPLTKLFLKHLNPTTLLGNELFPFRFDRVGGENAEVMSPC